MITLTPDQARALLYNVRWPMYESAVSDALAALIKGLREDRPTSPPDPDFFSVAGIQRAARRSMLPGPTTPDPRPKPQWANVGRATAIVRTLLHADPANVAHADALGAYIRDTFDALGLSLHDEETVYTAVTMVGLMVEMASNGAKKGNVEPSVVAGIAHIAQSVTASILDYIPTP